MNAISKKITGLARLLAPLIVAIGLITGPAVAHADAPIKLSLRQLGGQSGNFTLTMAPGESRNLQVQLANDGSETVLTQTFAADGYTLVNGGFGARFDGEPTSGATLWLKYPTETIDLAAGGSVDRTFTVSVPNDAKPGEYLTSLLLQMQSPSVATLVPPRSASRSSRSCARHWRSSSPSPDPSRQPFRLVR